MLAWEDCRKTAVFSVLIEMRKSERTGKQKKQRRSSRTLSEDMTEILPRSADELWALTKEIKKTKSAGEARTSKGVSNHDLSPGLINSPALEILWQKKGKSLCNYIPSRNGEFIQIQKGGKYPVRIQLVAFS
jgi:hypothetical protein